MQLVNLSYFFFLCFAVFVYWRIIPPGRRNMFLFLTGILFAGSFSPLYTVLFLILSALVWKTAAFLSADHPARIKKTVFASVLLFLAGGLFLYKACYAGLSRQLSIPSQTMVIFGFSYFTFRLIHYLIESAKGGVTARSWIDFFSYMFFFPIFLAGPLERFSSIQAQAARIRSVDARDLIYGLVRIIVGICKKILIADTLQRTAGSVLAHPEGTPWYLIALALYGAAIQLYMDFSGYCDIAIGSARLFGYRIMENFNAPFFKDNLASFWRSWHISLYNWIRDYFFFPVFGWKPSKVKNYIGIFASMLLFTLWHRMNINFLLLGVYNGLGLMGWYFFQGAKRKSAFLRRLVVHPCISPVGYFLTFSFFSFGVIFFRDTFPEAAHIARGLLYY